MMPSLDQLNAWALSGALLLFKSMGIVSVGWLASRVLTRSAAHRVFIWRLTFVALLLLPMLQLITPVVGLGLVGVDHATLNRTAGLGTISTSLAGWIVALWACGAALSLLRLARDTRAARALGRRATPVRDAQMNALAQSLSRSAGIATIELRSTTELDSPALVGWRHPIVLLPAVATDWSANELRAVLCHELEHVRSRDWLVMLLERAISTLYWCNPFVLLARIASSSDRECAADNAVLRASIEPRAYANQLLRTARTRTQPRVAMSLAFANHGVEGRVRALFASPRTRADVSPHARLGMLTLSVSLAVGVAAMQPWTCLPPRHAAHTASE